MTPFRATRLGASLTCARKVLKSVGAAANVMDVVLRTIVRRLAHRAFIYLGWLRQRLVHWVESYLSLFHNLIIFLSPFFLSGRIDKHDKIWYSR